MSDPKIINPGQTVNIGSLGHLTQVQHKGDHVDIVDHLHKGDNPVGGHVVHTVNSDGTVSEK